jgi:hypothetical protein
LNGLDDGVDYMLSGGLNAGNVGEALRLANPPGLDISSGVESAPGVKDVGADRAFFAAATRRANLTPFAGADLRPCPATAISESDPSSAPRQAVQDRT